MAKKREGISKKVRFEVFKRDSFACQYCGKSAPDSVLNVDHIEPVARGGASTLLNLITSCFDCNSGKGDRPLSDKTILKKQINQAAMLSDRREQLQMLAEWSQSLRDETDVQVEAFKKYLTKNFDVALSESGKSDIRKAIRKYGFSDVIEATEKSGEQYLKDASSLEQADKFIKYIPKICYWQKVDRENPLDSELRKGASVAAKIWYSCERFSLTARLQDLNRHHSISPKDLLLFVTKSRGIRDFEEKVQEFLEKGDR